MAGQQNRLTTERLAYRAVEVITECLRRGEVEMTTWSTGRPW